MVCEKHKDRGRIEVQRNPGAVVITAPGLFYYSAENRFQEPLAALVLADFGVLDPDATEGILSSISWILS